jgi:transcriptional regulator with XRE-family HTH domain
MARMANRTRPSYEATRLATWILADIGRELRVARHASGLRQADVARLAGASAARICRVEHGRVATLGITAIARHAAAVGLKPSVKLYPLGPRLLDRPQLELLARFRARLHPSWTWQTEVPMPIPGDLRSADCLIRVDGCAVMVEAFTRLSDWQRQSASAARKKRDLEADRLVLLLAATHANRHAAAEAHPSVRDGSFPLGTREVLTALAEGADPMADGIVFL